MLKKIIMLKKIVKKIVKKMKINKLPVMKIGTNKKSVLFLWGVLIVSVSFGVYKNFTAIDTHTVHEKEIIEQRIVDTNGIENFVENFARDYYSWNNNKEGISKRTTAISKYLTKELQDLNADTVRIDIPTSSNVEDVQIWEVNQKQENEFAVIFTVEQTISEGNQKNSITAAYEVTVFVDSTGDMVIVQNPTLSSIPQKANYEVKVKEMDGTVDIVIMEEVTEFLKTFFKLYPTTSEKELSYFVKDKALEAIGGDYLFSELINPVYSRNGDNIEVFVSVKYLDQRSKLIHISQYKLNLQKDENWMIIK